MRKLFPLLLAFFAIGCIPLEDLLVPIIRPSEENGDVSVTPYAYQDTLYLELNYRDNASLAKWELDISRIGVKDPNADWTLHREDSIEGNPRAFTFKFTEPIPARFNNNYVSTGDYELMLTLFDVEGNKSVLVDTFNIQGDVLAPTIEGLTNSMSASLPANAPADAEFWACPQQPIKFFGLLKDRSKLRRVGFSYNQSAEASFPINTDRFEYDEVAIGKYLNDSLQIIIPTALNGQLVELKIFAEDVFRNRIERTFKVWIDCDVQAPSIELVEASKVPINGIAYVVENTDFVIKQLRLQDNKSLQKAVIRFAEKGKPLADYQTYMLDNATDTTLKDIVVPSALLALGKTYQFVIGVTDNSTVLLPGGNLSEMAFELQVVKDEAPKLVSMDFYINKGTAQQQVFTGVAVGSTVNVSGVLGTGLPKNFIADGKVEDDVAVERLIIRWKTPGGLTSLPVSITFDPAVSVVKYTDHYSPTAMLFTTPGTYSLEIVATDTKGQVIPATARTYFINVLN